MKKRALTLTIAAAMALSLTGCGGEKTASKDAPTLSAEEADQDLDYQYGADVTFHSDEPVEYSMMFSDHENYPMKEDWRLWSYIEEKTNVKFKLTTVARTDYNQKVTAAVSSGSAPYIVPKIYDSKAYEDSGQVVAVSDWVQYMPNYSRQVEE